MSIRGDGGDYIVPALDSAFSQEEVSMDLTMCGLLVERAETIAGLYATHRDWTTVENQWFDERIDGRSTRESSQKIYRVLSSRFKTASPSLPAISRLPSVFEQCETERNKAQVLYFYLIEDDPLVKFAVHQYIQQLKRHGVTGLDFGESAVASILREFRYTDGETLNYADSTIYRWGQGLRSVMRDIGVLETQQSVSGQIPNVGEVPLLVASGYSFEEQGTEWLSRPLGWLYLFQQDQHWESLAERVASNPGWKAIGLRGDLRLQPTDETYGWADAVGGKK